MEKAFYRGNMKRILGAFAVVVLMGSVYSDVAQATPGKVIIVRHADKLKQPKPGPSLSSQGIVRSIKFAMTYERGFPEPDFMFATTPEKKSGKDASIRELQTLAPLNNIYSARHPNAGVKIFHPYSGDEYNLLAKDLLSKKEYDGKTILICWEHHVIPNLAQELGTTEQFKWEGDDFDTILVLDYKNGKLDKFEKHPNAYDVSFTGDWTDLYAKLDEQYKKND